MNKVIAIISEDEVLSGHAQRFRVNDETFKQRKKFIQKQIDDLQKDARAAEKRYDQAITERLKELGKFPSDFNPKTDQVCADYDRDCVLWHRHDKDCGHGMMVQMFEMMRPPKDDE